MEDNNANAHGRTNKYLDPVKKSPFIKYSFEKVWKTVTKT